MTNCYGVWESFTAERKYIYKEKIIKKIPNKELKKRKKKTHFPRPSSPDPIPTVALRQYFMTLSKLL